MFMAHKTIFMIAFHGVNMYIVNEVASFQGLSQLAGVEPFKKPLEYEVVILSIHVS